MAAAPVIPEFVVGPDGTEEAVSLTLNDVAVAARVLQMSRNTQVRYTTQHDSASAVTLNLWLEQLLWTG